MPDADPAQPHDPRARSLRSTVGRELRRTLAIVGVLALLAGVAFPIVVLVVGQLAFPAQAGGSLVRDATGQVVGSTLVGQAFSGPEYFHGRPSAAGEAGYDGSASSGLNLAPTHPELAELTEQRAREPHLRRPSGREHLG